jgi:lipopolysaccharide biosynthesis glycosyltransferase
MERLHISLLFCADASYFQHAGATIASILETNPKHEFEIFVCSEKRDYSAEQKLKVIVSQFGNATINFVEFNLPQMQGHVESKAYISVATYLRLFMTEFLEPRVKRVLYLDCDLIVCGDLGELWQTDLQGAWAAGVVDPVPETFEHLDFQSGTYVNAGVLLADLEQWRESNILSEFLAYASNPRFKFKNHDQDILNVVLRGKIKPLDYRWNFQSFQPDMSAKMLNISRSAFRKLRRFPSIIHFTTEYKPWIYGHEPHYKKLYYKALALTPWRGWQPPDRTPRAIILKFLKLKRLKERIAWYAPGLSRYLRRALRMLTTSGS